jgi:Holliday junction resolvasome RuvABC endonuclease subunit
VKIVGIDPSLTSTGLAVIVDGRASVDRLATNPCGDTVEARVQRTARIVTSIRDWTLHADLVVIEGPSYSSGTGHAHDRAGLWWAIASRIVHDATPVAVAPPACRAMLGTGRGNATKDAVLAAVIKRYPDVEITGNDEADALVLAAAGSRWLGSPIDDLPQTHLRAMAKIQWPEEGGA